MNKIKSFQVDHDKLEKGLYISSVDGDIITYDLRFKKPNQGDYLDDAAMHSIEHSLATILRNSSRGEDIIYFGPMGCRTGFYLLTKSSLSKEDTIKLLQNALKELIYKVKIVPGSKQKECGNYLNHDLKAAKKEAKAYLEVIKDYQPEDLMY